MRMPPKMGENLGICIHIRPRTSARQSVPGPKRPCPAWATAPWPTSTSCRASWRIAREPGRRRADRACPGAALGDQRLPVTLGRRSRGATPARGGVASAAPRSGVGGRGGPAVSPAGIELGVVPTVGDLLERPELGLRLPPEAAARLLGKVEGVAAVLRVAAAAPERAEPDQWTATARNRDAATRWL